MKIEDGGSLEARTIPKNKREGKNKKSQPARSFHSSAAATTATATAPPPHSYDYRSRRKGGNNARREEGTRPGGT
jgi:hypothetical protein